MIQINHIESTSQFADENISDSKGFKYLRPKILLKLIEDNNEGPVSMQLQIPSASIGSLTMLEATMLVALIHLIKPASIFEFGTFLGYSTFIFLNNSDANCKVYSLDLGNTAQDVGYTKDLSLAELKTNDVANDHYLSYIQSVKGLFYLSGVTNTVKERLHLLMNDSRSINVEDLNLTSNIDFVFVDGGHELEIIEIDTANAFRMIGDHGIIVWHDYNSNIHKDVTIFLNQLASNLKIFHIENTMLAFCIVGVEIRHNLKK